MKKARSRILRASLPAPTHRGSGAGMLLDKLRLPEALIKSWIILRAGSSQEPTLMSARGEADIRPCNFSAKGRFSARGSRPDLRLQGSSSFEEVLQSAGPSELN